MRITEELRHAAVKLVNAGKIAVGSAVIQGGRKGSRKRNANAGMVEEIMQAKVEKEICRQPSRKRDDEENLKRLFDDPLNNTTPPPPPPTKIFIRSRL